MEQLFDLLVARAHEVAPHLIHAAWLGVAVIALPALFLRFSRWGNAATRYALCWGLLVAVVALPAMLGIVDQVGDIITSRQSEQPAVYSPSHTADASTLDRSRGESKQMASLDQKRTDRVSAGFVGAGPVVTPLTPKPSLRSESRPITPIEENGFEFSMILGLVPAFLLAVCLAISAFLLIRVVLSLGYLAYTVFKSQTASPELQERAEYWSDRLACPRSIKVKVTESLRSPAATGYFGGIVLLPAEMLDNFASCDIDAVLIHEISHLMRFDDWARLGEHLFAAFFFYLPAVHWLVRQIDLHREIACDDLVVATTGRPAEYARTLTRLAEFSNPNPKAVLAPGAMITKKQIFARFAMILSTGRSRDNRLASRALTTVFVTLIAAILLVGQQLPALTLPGSTTTFAEVSRAIFGDEEPPAIEEAMPSRIETDWARAVRDAKPNVRFSAPIFVAQPDNWLSEHQTGSYPSPAAPSVPAVPSVPSLPSAPSVQVAPSAFAVNRVGLSEEEIEELVSLATASAQTGIYAAAEAGPVTEAVESAVRGIENSLRNITDWRGTVSDIDEDQNRGYYEYRDGRTRIRMEWDGELTFTDDMLGLEAIEPGGYFELEGHDRRDRVRVLIESDRNGKLDYLFYRDGHSEEYDADARAWFESTLTDMVRISGLGAERRVAMIFDKDGVDGVLAEIEEIPTNHARSKYYVALIDDNRLDADERSEVFRHAGRWLDSDHSLAEFIIRAADEGLVDEDMMPDIVRTLDGMDSDYEMRRLLTAIGIESSNDPDVLIEVLRIAKRMDSNYERAELLIEIAPKISGDKALIEAYVDAVIDIDSDYETRRVLQALHFDHDIDPVLAAQVMPIISDMDSDYEKTELLIEMAMAAESDQDLFAMYVDIASSIDSDYEMRRALQELSYLNSANDSTLLKLIFLAKQLDSDYERAEFLREMAEVSHRSDAMRAAYLDAAVDIDSDYDKSRVLQELIERGEGDEEFLGEMLKAVDFIDSDFEKANILRTMSPMCARYPDLEDPFVEAIESISGSYERDKLYRSFYRDLRRLQ